jgi:hypothetical protein
MALVHEAMPDVAGQRGTTLETQAAPRLLIDSLSITYMRAGHRGVPFSNRLGDNVIYERPPQGRPRSLSDSSPGVADDLDLCVHLTGRLPNVPDKPTAARLLMDEYAPRLARLGRRPGLGFHVPADQADAYDRQAVTVLHLRPHIEGAHDRADGLELDGRRPGLKPGKSPVPIPQPATDTPTAWRFEIGFGLKLGSPGDRGD